MTEYLAVEWTDPITGDKIFIDVFSKGIMRRKGLISVNFTDL